MPRRLPLPKKARRSLYPAAARPYLLDRLRSMGMAVQVGKPREMLSFAGGLSTYMAKCNESAERGYEGFVIG